MLVNSHTSYSLPYDDITKIFMNFSPGCHWSLRLYIFDMPYFLASPSYSRNVFDAKKNIV